MMSDPDTWTHGTNTWGTTDPYQQYYIYYYDVATSDTVEVDEEQFVSRQYVDEWFVPAPIPVREFKTQCYGKRWFEHCRKRNGRDRLMQTMNQL